MSSAGWLPEQREAVCLHIFEVIAGALSTLLCHILFVFSALMQPGPGAHSITVQYRARLHKDKKNPAQQTDFSALT
ncbi:MAG: hypothetical protein CSA32_02335 [Desulfobulbus propionicus]|nr:MAG: hypothetical protein CSA32_02335 [Desulfobulbus propionicus]